MPQLGAADATGKIRRIRPIFIITTENFNPRSPHGERRPRARTPRARTLHFNPRSPHGERHLPLALRHADFPFQPTLPHGERQDYSARPGFRGAISTHAPAWGATSYPHPENKYKNISTHAPARGATRCHSPTLASEGISTHAPARGATYFAAQFRRCDDISTHAPARGATTFGALKDMIENISTHATRTGSDASRLFCSTLRCNISTHAPRTGSDAITRSASFSCIPFQPTLPARGATNFSSSVMYLPRFQPTLPARGATAGRKGGTRRGAHFNPRSPHGERQWLSRRADHLASISTHAPRTGSDGCQLAGAACQRIISTHAPRTGSDALLQRVFSAPSISTHAPRTGSDRRRSLLRRTNQYFNPRSPHGERHKLQVAFTNTHIFQPTLPARGATPTVYKP